MKLWFCLLLVTIVALVSGDDSSECKTCRENGAPPGWCDELLKKCTVDVKGNTTSCSCVNNWLAIALLAGGVALLVILCCVCLMCRYCTFCYWYQKRKDESGTRMQSMENVEREHSQL